MFNTLILVIIAIICATYVIRIVDAINHHNLHVSDILVVLLCLGIIINAHFSDKAVYHNGYVDAIESAELVEVTDEGYFIDFNGEVHEYTFD